MAEEVKLAGLRLRVKTPRVVTEGVGYCWYANILQFPTSELMVTHSLCPDSRESLYTARAVLLSDDGGQTWGHGYDVNGFENAAGEVRISLPDGSIAGPSYSSIRPDPAGQWRDFAVHYWRFDKGGRRYGIEPWGGRIEGLPRDVGPWRTWSRWAFARISMFGSAVEVTPGRYITTCTVNYEGDQRGTTEAVVSEDRGRTWRYLSTVAGPDAVPDAREGFDEPCMVQLADGDLMCISRVGARQPLGRTYSSDGGVTWAPVDRLPAAGVAPDILRLENGVIALSTGRPGIVLWLSTDGRGQTWESFDLMAYHNSVMDAPHHIHVGPGPFDLANPDQTTGYTAMVEVSPNRILLVYDRMPYGWMPVPTDAEVRSRILLNYPTSSLRLPPGSMLPPERERIYLLELDIERQ